MTLKNSKHASENKNKGVNLAKQKAQLATIGTRVKAFITDLFLIGMPIYYLTTYVFLDGKDDFLHKQTAIFGANFAVALICCAFFAIKAQTPGYRSQNIYLIDLRSGRKLGFARVLLRYICFLLAGVSVVGLCLCFFRKDALNLHDLLTHSAAVCKKTE